jgi:nicotinamidase-related amidase
MKFYEGDKKHDLNFISGQALSHCYASTARQIISNMDSEDFCKLVILIDTTSPVPNFEKDANYFISEIKGLGIKILKTADVFL